MAKLIYSAIRSLDGYVEDEQGRFDWAAPDEEVHRFVNELERPIGTYLYGRRMYETMVYWDSPPDLAGQPRHIEDFAALWRAADKVVYSTKLAEPTSARTRIERRFDPDAVTRMKAAATADLSIGGAALAATALTAGLVDELHLFLTPVIVGGGKPALPATDPLELVLLGEHRFAGGVVHLHYRIAATEPRP